MAKFLAAAALLAGSAQGANVKIEAMKHDIQLVTPQNFDGVISKFRDSSVSSVWYFKGDRKVDQNFLDEYNKVAKDLKGMSKICALDCSEFGKYCEKQGIKFHTDTVKVMVYPVNPMPPFQYEGKAEAKGVSAKVTKFMPDNSVKLTKEDSDKYLTTDPTKPKVILFTSAKKAPTIWKALSSETVFRRTIKFAFISEEDAELCGKFKVKKFPTLIMHRGAKAEIKETYKGEMNFLAIKEWINLHSESGMGDKVAGAGGKEEESVEDAKPWLVQEVPELTAKSHNDICFKGEGLCVIYLKDGELSSAETDMLSKLSKQFTSQLSDRGAKMKFMWINLAVEQSYKDLFDPAQMPSAVVFNPHKRLRFAKLDHGEDGEVKGDERGIEKLMESVLGGDARFKMVPGQKMPAWAARAVPGKEGKKEL
jgi:hypothetical protein